jgi:hypothetical protein
MRDIVNNTGFVQVMNPQTVQAAALNSGNIDLQGADALAVAVLVGNIADTLSGSVRLDLKIEHAEDDGTGAPASYANCTDEDVLNYSGLAAGVFKSLTANTDKNKRYVIGYRGGRRFVRVTATPVSLATGGAVAMLALKGESTQKPANNA